MNIILRNELAKTYQECLDIRESLMGRNLRNPKEAFRLETEKMREQVFDSLEIIKMFPAYFVIAISQQLKFGKFLCECEESDDGVYPEIAIIRRNALVSEDLLREINRLKSLNMKDEVDRAILLVFCLQNRESVCLEQIEICSGDLYQETEYKERGGEEYDE